MNDTATITALQRELATAMTQIDAMTLALEYAEQIHQNHKDMQRAITRRSEHRRTFPPNTGASHGRYDEKDAELCASINELNTQGKVATRRFCEALQRYKQTQAKRLKEAAR